MFETTNELILVISTCIAGICSIIAAIRLSKCEYVRICGGLFLIKRNLINNSKNSAPNASNSITKIINGISNGINKTDANTSNNIENPENISPSASTLSLHSAISV
jgi:hypothetical protein